jgi:hypothetical protein
MSHDISLLSLPVLREKGFAVLLCQGHDVLAAPGRSGAGADL